MRTDWTWLRQWPLLVATAALIIAGEILLSGAEYRATAGFVLVNLGAVCLGAWIVLLARGEN